MKISLLLLSVGLSCALTGAEKITRDFSSWQKSGTVDLSRKAAVTVVHGEMQGGELRVTVPKSQLKKFGFAVIERIHSQGPWHFSMLDGLNRITINPIDASRQKLNYKITPKMIEKFSGTVTFAIKMSPDSTLELGSFSWSDRQVNSKRYEPRRQKGPLRKFTAPNGKTYTIPAKFEDVTPPVRREKVQFNIAKNDSYVRTFIVDDITTLHPNLCPSAEEFSREIALFAAPGQKEAEAFTVYALKNLQIRNIQATAPRSATGQTLPLPQIRQIRVWPQRLAFVSSQYRDVPELLEKIRNTDLKAQTGQPYYFKVNVPWGTQPGLYRGKITISSDRYPVQVLNYQVRVTKLQLVKDFKPIIGVYYGSPDEFELIKDYGLTSSLQGHQSAMYQVLRPLDQIARREPDVQKRLKLLYNGHALPQLNFAEKRDTGFDNFIRAYQKAGFRKVLVWFACAGFTDRIAKFLNLPISKKPQLRIYPETLTPEYRKLFVDCIKAINQRAARSGVTIYWYQFDELGINSQLDVFKYAVEMFKLVKEAGGKTCVTCGEDEFTQMVHPYLDMRIYSASCGSDRKRLERVRKDTRKDNREFYSYTDCTRETPHLQRYESGLNMWISNWDGRYFWNLHSRRNDVWNDFDHPCKDSNALYQLGKEFIPTLQLEALREGIDDFRYLYTLDDLVAKCLKSSNYEVKMAGKRVQQELAMLKKELPIWIRRGADWDPRNFRRYRWRISTLAEELQELLAGRKASCEIKFFDVQAQKKSSVEFTGLLKAPLTAQKITVDGNFNEAAWRGSFTVPALKLPSGAKPEVPTEIRLLRDQKYLYLAFRCFEPDVSQLVMNQKIPDHLVWRDDSVEIFYDSKLDHTNYKQIIVNALGNFVDIESINGKKNQKWNCPNLKIGAKVGQGEWRAEVAIPLTEFKSPYIGMNFMRTRVKFLTYVMLRNDPHNPRNYSTLQLVDRPTYRLALPTQFLTGQNPVCFEADTAGILKISVNRAPANSYQFTAHKKVNLPVDIAQVGKNVLTFTAQAPNCPQVQWNYTEQLAPALVVDNLPFYLFKQEKFLTVSGLINTQLAPNQTIYLQFRLLRHGEEIYNTRAAVKGRRFAVKIPLLDLLPQSAYQMEISLRGKQLIDRYQGDFYLMQKF